MSFDTRNWWSRRQGCQSTMTVLLPSRLWILNENVGDCSKNKRQSDWRALYERERGALFESASIILCWGKTSKGCLWTQWRTECLEIKGKTEWGGLLRVHTWPFPQIKDDESDTIAHPCPAAPRLACWGRARENGGGGVGGGGDIISRGSPWKKSRGSFFCSWLCRVDCQSLQAGARRTKEAIWGMYKTAGGGEPSAAHHHKHPHKHEGKYLHLRPSDNIPNFISFFTHCFQVFVLAVLIGVVCARPQDATNPPVAILSSESEGPNLDGSYKFKWVYFTLSLPFLLSISSRVLTAGRLVEQVRDGRRRDTRGGRRPETDHAGRFGSYVSRLLVLQLTGRWENRPDLRRRRERVPAAGRPLARRTGAIAGHQARTGHHRPHQRRRRGPRRRYEHQTEAHDARPPRPENSRVKYSTQKQQRQYRTNKIKFSIMSPRTVLFSLNLFIVNWIQGKQRKRKKKEKMNCHW